MACREDAQEIDSSLDSGGNSSDSLQHSAKRAKRSSSGSDDNVTVTRSSLSAINYETLTAYDHDIAKAFLRDLNTKLMRVDKIIYKFNGTIWEKTSDEFLRQSIGDWARAFYDTGINYVNNLPSTGSPIKKTLKEILDKCTNRPGSGAIRTIQETLTSNKTLDDNEDLIAFKNMVFCNKTLSVRPGNPDDMISKCLQCDYIPRERLSAESIDFVKEFFENLFPDAEICEYVKVALSQIFCGRNNLRQYQIWTGIGNGKSLLTKLFETMLGEDLFTKVNKRALVSEHPKDMHKLCVVRMIVTEVGSNDKIDSGRFKVWSGGDSLTARQPQQKSDKTLTFYPRFIPILVCQRNELPRFIGGDDATKNRIRLIPFETYFTGEGESAPPEIDPNYVRRNEMFDGLSEHLSAFASILLHIYIDFETRHRKGEVTERIPNRVMGGSCF